MYQTPPPTPSPPRKRRERRSDRRTFGFRMEVVLAIGLAVAVAAGLIVAGGSGRWLEVLVLGAGVTIALLAGWPASGSAALGSAAAFLVLEAVFGRLDNDHIPGILVLTAGILGSILAAGFARAPEASADDPLPAARPGANPWLHERPGRGRLPAGTLEYEIERARRHERQLSLLAIVPDRLDALAAGAGDSLPKVLDLIDAAIEDAVRAIDVVERMTRTRFRVCLPETSPDLARAVAERIRLRI